MPTEAGLKQDLAGVGDGLAAACEELREISHGVHPALLSKGGLRSALRSFARRAAVPVALSINVEQRLPESGRGGGLLRCRRGTDERR